ncbi:hypothetical protein [Paraburkholderia susongensis]|uniref:Uncharacterized protein n=1 Tax=Paraburkholderia susongensis TaxID=1515439 RepID=A0A1X7LLX0_9BURK|nr:hypothetical protein [Paraburkholderia susongensis]SMG54888.1 hypothetical protein SAMN06265784_10724 [Paraburkholderia susongensis]
MSEPVSYRHPENGIQNASGRRPGIDRRQMRPVCKKACHQQKFGWADVPSIANRHPGGIAVIWPHT